MPRFIGSKTNVFDRSFSCRFLTLLRPTHFFSHSQLIALLPLSKGLLFPLEPLLLLLPLFRSKQDVNVPAEEEVVSFAPDDDDPLPPPCFFCISLVPSLLELEEEEAVVFL